MIANDLLNMKVSVGKKVAEAPPPSLQNNKSFTEYIQGPICLLIQTNQPKETHNTERTRHFVRCTSISLEESCIIYIFL